VLVGGDTTSGVRIFLISSIIFDLCMMIAWIVATVWLFKKKRSFPNFFIILLLIECIAALIIAVIAAGVFNAPLTAEDFKDGLRPFVYLAVWGPYMMKSKRVRNTFGKPHADEDYGEWTDADKEKFKRLMDSQRRSGP